MTGIEQPQSVGLEDVRARFTQAEASLARAAKALGHLRSSIEELDGARDELRNVGSVLIQAATTLQSATGSLEGHVQLLKEGVDALKRSDPAQLERRIVDVQQTMLTSLDKCEARVRDFVQAASDQQMQALGRHERALAESANLAQRTRLELRIVMALIVIVAAILAVGTWVR
jgi:chromosome segregation ATPase